MATIVIALHEQQDYCILEPYITRIWVQNHKGLNHLVLICLRYLSRVSHSEYAYLHSTSIAKSMPFTIILLYSETMLDFTYENNLAKTPLASSLSSWERREVG